MSYCFSREVKGSFKEVENRVRRSLSDEGFGILTEIDVQETLKKKLDVDFRKYKILGACNPPFAYKALQVEDKIGTMLPCNIIIQKAGPDEVEVAAIDPVASMQAVKNAALQAIAEQVQQRLKKVIDRI